MNIDFVEVVNWLDEMKIEEDLEILEVIKNDEDYEEDVFDILLQGVQFLFFDVVEDKGSVCSGQEGFQDGIKLKSIFKKELFVKDKKRGGLVFVRFKRLIKFDKIKNMLLFILFFKFYII